MLTKRCSALLEQGPPWAPAKDAFGTAVAFEEVFTCKINVRGSRTSPKLHTKQIGATGPIAGEQVAHVVSEHLQELAHCFAMASRRASPLGQHWLAFEIRPDGAVGRMEWVEGAVTDPTGDACLIDVLRGWHFPPTFERTIADIDFYISTYESAFD
jgi:hypothetical protein